MSSLARVLSVMLATQACWAVQLSVSHSGQIEEADEIRSSAQTMLEELEALARGGANPAKDRINDIKKIVEDELLPDLKQTRDSEANQVKTNLAAIDTCNSNAVSSHSNIKATTQAAVEQARKDHAACREEEKNKHSDKNSKCTELDNFLKTINVPADLPAGRPRDQMVQYVKTMSTYFCPKGPQVTTLDDACTSATSAHGKHRDQCEKLQDAFELGFCTWRTELTDTCSNLKTCYDGALDAYNVHVAATKTLVKKWKTEYAALKKISCYVDVWLKDSNVNTADADQLAHCHSSNIDTTPMDVDYGTPAAKAECSQNLQKDYPGSPGFPTTEYSNFKDYVDEVTPCVSQTTAVMTTTLAPGTEVVWHFFKGAGCQGTAYATLKAKPGDDMQTCSGWECDHASGGCGGQSHLYIQATCEGGGLKKENFFNDEQCKVESPRGAMQIDKENYAKEMAGECFEPTGQHGNKDSMRVTGAQHLNWPDCKDTGLLQTSDINAAPFWFTPRK